MARGDRSRLTSFLLGSLLGGLAGLAAGRIRRARAERSPQGPPGLAAFEEAPCYREHASHEAPPEAELRPRG